MTGAITGGVFGAAFRGIQVGKAAKMWDKGSFKTGFQSMRHHHAINGSGRNVVQFTNDAVNFAGRNGNAFTLLQPRPGLQAGWGLNRGFGSGMNGLFTSKGKIITFKYRFNPFI